MLELTNDIFQRWTHSFEEDTGDMTVYRPADYTFPRARGRAGIEFQPNGTFIDWTISPADTRRPVNGHWQKENDNRLLVNFETGVRPARILEIVRCDSGILMVRQLAAQP
jgi:hypothetical protein